jgi:ATP-dependent DNA helicase RecG
MNKPYFVKSLGAKNGTFVRVGRSTMLATPEIADDIRWRSKGRSYDTRPLSASSKSNLDETKYLEFRKQLTKAQRTTVGPISDWPKLRILSSEGKYEEATIGGLLLFGKDPQFFLPEAKIFCSHFKGASGRDALAHLECSGTLFDQHNAAMNFIETQIPTAFSIRQTKKTEELLVPRVALREALSNLIVHRDYSMNAPSKIAIFSDRIEFFSPGVFPGPFSKANLESGLTYIRNQTITLFFHKSGIIERLGTGFTTILSTYRSLSEIEPQIIEGDGFVKCVMPFLNTANALDPLSESQKEQRNIRRIFYIWGKVSAAELEKELKVSRSTANRILGKLLEEGIIAKGPKSVYVWL